jgi:prepilin-type N-terminal cleavage/methylation domain-containing protein
MRKIKTPSFKSAFSLIELSIVVLVIGILIAGALQGSKLINSFKLTTARALTKSSPVPGINDLAAWYESTSSGSFDSTVNEDRANRAISSWYDINPQSPRKNNATQSDVSKQPTYIIEEKTGLPMVYFDGSNDGFNLPDGTIPPADNSFTVIIVAKPLFNETFDKTFLSTEDTLNLNNLIFRYRYISKSTNNFYILGFVSGSNVYISPSTNINIDINKITVLSSSYSNGYSNTYLKNGARYSSYINGKFASGSIPQRALATPSINNSIGFRKNNITNPLINPSDHLYGYIGELIIFNRYLKPEEKNEIWKYLSQKWGALVPAS